MSLFPLYDEIISEMDGTESCLSKNHCTTITRLNKDHLNLIYLIILHDYLKNNPNKKDLPYNSKTISKGKGVTFKKIDQLPENTQKIIHRYLLSISKK